MASTKTFKWFFSRHPVGKGMVSYSILCPIGCALQQLIKGTQFREIDLKQCMRFSLYGGLCIAPAFYTWVRVSSNMWPETNFKSGLKKVSFGPFAISCFYIGMNLLERRTLRDGLNELREKFLPTWRVGFCFWPIVQTINFSLVAERNRVVFVSFFSVAWATFLAYMKQLKMQKKIRPQ